MEIAMKFVLLFGPQAVGKMTVGYELEKQTGLKLFHNHMSIELLQPYFGFSKEMWRIAKIIRTEVFESYAKTDEYGMIFTFVWAFNIQEDWEFVEEITQIFKSQGAEVYYVELAADLDARIARNTTPFRLEQKPTKRNTEQSTNDLVQSLEKYRLNSSSGEIKYDNYIKIDNTHLEPAEVAKMIKDVFEFRSI